MHAITFDVCHATLPQGPILGFRFIWAMDVNGYDPSRHCQRD